MSGGAFKTLEIGLSDPAIAARECVGDDEQQQSECSASKTSAAAACSNPHELRKHKLLVRPAPIGHGSAVYAAWTPHDTPHAVVAAADLLPLQQIAPA